MNEPSPLRVLFVEDREDDALLLIREIRSHGYELTTRRVVTEAEMREAFEASDWDAVIADFSLPGFSAGGALEVLRDRGLDIPFIIVTGAVGEESAVDAMRAGANDFIGKDSLARLVPALEREIRDSAHRRENAAARHHREASDRRFRAIVEHSPTAVGLLGESGTIRYNSPALSRILGYTPEELMGANAFDLVHPDDLPSVMGAFHAALAAQGEPFEVEHRCRHRDGHWLMLHTIGESHLDDPEIASVVVNSHDITAQKSAEAALLKRDREMETLTRNAPDLLVRFDRELRHQFVNPIVEQITGHPPDRFLGRTIGEMWLTDGAVVERWEQALREVFGSGESRTLDFDADTPTGSRRFQSRLAPEVGDDGSVESVLAFTRDVTDLHRAWEAVRVGESRFRALIEGGTDLVYVVDETGQILYVSPSVERVLGYAVDERRGGGIFDLIHPDDLPWARELLEHHREARDAPVEGRIRVRHSDGSWRVLEVTGRSQLDDPSIGGIVVHARDVSRRVELEHELRHAQKMEAVGRLAGGVAHDFNNLLTVIRGNAQLALLDLPEEHPSRIEIEEVRAAADRAAELTTQLLAFSRKQVLQPRDLEVGAVLAGMRSMLLRLIGEDIELVFEPPAVPLHVRADPGQLDQVVMNLAVNARDAMPSGGQLTIETSIVEVVPGGQRLRGEVLAPGEYVLLSVGDTGEGMSEDTLGRIFDPFFTTRSTSGGTGLGLSTVYGIVKQSGGSISVTSEPGTGSCFRIYLPRVTEEAACPEVAEQEDSVAPHAREFTVLLVEDDENVRGLLKKVLSRWRYTVLEAGNGKDAVEISRDYGGEIHLLMTDVVMPTMNGPRAALEIAAQRPGIRLLFMSGYTDEALVRNGINGQEARIIMKPITPVALAQTLEEIWNGGGDATPSSGLRREHGAGEP